MHKLHRQRRRMDDGGGGDSVAQVGTQAQGLMTTTEALEAHLD